ncbi:hypothetical protein V2S66_23070 [Streptomyces sp. V4-01]|uniref:Uncharacterized protein n=1 Tax=Actinacidiphila polyblastidii TaxID=3110430 RepID=A0ABU7PGA6_9ACTN|nr:hypothetical protein [Streptomyces sp. V4-01]
MSAGSPSAPRWSLALTVDPAGVVEAMPKDLQRAVLLFLQALVIETGGAVEAGKPAPGSPLDDAGLRYSVLVPGEPVIVEYLVVPVAREVRIPTLVWMH